MKFTEAKAFVYKNCAARVKRKITESQKSLLDIYEPDPKILSAIQNNRITKNNPYLVPKRVMENELDGLVTVGIFNSKCEVLWGNKEEVEQYAQELFMLLFADLQMNVEELDFNPDEILCDYVPYAKDSTVIDCLLTGCSNDFFISTIESVFMTNIVANKEKALRLLYGKCKDEYLESLLKFTSETDSFKKIDCVIEKNFIQTYFVPMLKKQKPSAESLGFRVREMIMNDFSQAPEHPNGIEDDYFRELIQASSEYIAKLEKIQEAYM